MDVYLLNIEELLCDGAEARIASVLHRLDEDRRRKVASARTPRGRAAALGAGLLLQKAVEDWRTDGLGSCPEESGGTGQGAGSREQSPRIRHCTLSGLLSERSEPLSLTYRYGEKGKPYFREIPLFFSLSHSGAYVLCAVSRREVGADIQKIQPVDARKLAKRFFSESESRTLERCESEGERQRLFFGFWTRKEAYGKLTGKGVAAVLGEDLQNMGGKEFVEQPQVVPFHGNVQDVGAECAVERAEKVPVREEGGSGAYAGRNVEWTELLPPEGYAASVCRFCENGFRG